MALSATCRWGPAMHLISLLNSFGISGSNLVISHTSKTSNNSFKNITSFAELANGQYLNNPSTKSVASYGSFDRNSIEQRSNYS